jgi:BON domain
MRNELGLGVLGAAGLGAGLMFLLDPEMGNRRRAILRDKLGSLMRLTAWAADKTSRDVKNRVFGTVQSTKSRFSGNISVSDDILVERVRSQMGRAVSHPHAIHVVASNGMVTLTGEILSGELNQLLRSVFAVKGVEKISNRLTLHEGPAGVSGLQGGHSRTGSRFSLLQSNWPPAVRLMVGASGIAAAAAGIKRGGILGAILSGAGAVMTGLAVTNKSVRHIIDRASTVAGQPAKTLRFPTERRAV